MKIIKDCIYGFIELPDLCREFIDTPEFKRLHRIKQLGLAYTVYPSAVHTRFEHCLGVMHLTGKVIEQICDNVDIRTKELIQLGGLLHDVGHVASSHLFDYILEEENKLPEHLQTHEERSILILKKINERKKLLTEREEEIIKAKKTVWDKV
jgi:HD superfamily phosphohydrolase